MTSGWVKSCRATLVALLTLLAVAHAGTARAVPGARKYFNKAAAWYGSAEAARVAANILSYQAASGGWPKNIDTTATLYTGDPAKLKASFDNGATTDELRLLARIYQPTQKSVYSRAFLKGLDHILAAQYPSGGWPQCYPPGKQYHRHITFNDDAMVRLMEFVREVATADLYGFVDGQRRSAARKAFAAGIQCILKCQIEVGGKRTAWCAQHDERDYRPRPGRTFELVSLSGAESVGIVRLLMSLDRPGPEVVQAIDGAVAWFKAVQLKGIRMVVTADNQSPTGKNRVVVKDAAAPALWARFYEIGTNRPLFADRDGVARYDLAAIGYERRNGYRWYGYWPQRLMTKAYPAWKEKVGGK